MSLNVGVTLTLIDFTEESKVYCFLRQVFRAEQAKRLKQILRMDALKLIEYDSENFHLILNNYDEKNELIDDEEFMRKAVGFDGRLYQYASERLQNNYQVILAAVKENGMILSDIPREYHTREMVLQAVKQDGQSIPYDYIHDLEIATEAVKSNGMALGIINLDTDEIVNLAFNEHLVGRFDDIEQTIYDTDLANRVALFSAIFSGSRNDLISVEILETVLKNHPESYQHLGMFNLSQEKFFEMTKATLQYSDVSSIDSTMLNDFSIEEYEELAKYDGEILTLVNGTSQTRNMVLNALENGGSMTDVAEEFCDDLFILKEAIKEDAYAICFADLELIDSRSFVLDCVKINGDVLEYVSEEYRNDKEIVLSAVMNCGTSLGYASKMMQEDEEIVMSAVSNCGQALGYVGDNMIDNRDVILKAVSLDGLALEYATIQDTEIVMTALNQSVLAFEFIEDEFITKEIVLMVLKQFSSMYEKCKMCHDRDVTLCAVKEYGANLHHAPEDLKSDREIVLAAVNSCGLSLRYAAENLKDDFEIVKAAILNNPFSIQYASNRLKLNLSLARLSSQLKVNDLAYFDSWQLLEEDEYKKRCRSTEDEDEEDEFSPPTKQRK